MEEEPCASEGGPLRIPSSSPSTSSQAWHQELSQGYQSKPPSLLPRHPGPSPGSCCREMRLAPFALISASIYDIDISSYGVFHLAKSFSATTLTPLKTIYCSSSVLSLCSTLCPHLTQVPLQSHRSRFGTPRSLCLSISLALPSRPPPSGSPHLSPA